ncbi:hypothetical protein C824_004590 [Schaedlerella arabinosiphila]|nr:hypothetical protein C824_004590 [Schaedlerella arabinosiphila]
MFFEGGMLIRNFFHIFREIKNMGCCFFQNIIKKQDYCE